MEKNSSQQYQNKIDWVSFEKSCNDCHCSKNVFSFIFLAHKYFNAPLPEKIRLSAMQYLDAGTEKLFILYLKGNSKEISKEINNNNIKSLGKINGLNNKIKYLFGDIFPSVSFMLQRYQIKYKPLIYLYYLVRIRSGVAGLFSHLLKSKKKF